jgi:hypothetical protein
LKWHWTDTSIGRKLLAMPATILRPVNRLTRIHDHMMRGRDEGTPQELAGGRS